MTDRTAADLPGLLAGRPAPAVHSPASTDEAGRTLRELAERGARVAFLGGGTELELGAPPRSLDAVVRTGAMARVLDYAPADMVMTVEAGVTLAALQATARAHGQRLALDPPRPEQATLGGLVATGASGPLRARYGAIRDLIIGVTLVRADGAVARGGGKVVKNVAGFDLPKVACGSLGTLAMIAEATFRLHPLPEVRRAVVARGIDPRAAWLLVERWRAAQLEPCAAYAVRDPQGRYDLVVVFEGFEAGVRQQTDRLQRLAREAGPGTDLLDEEALGPVRARHDQAREAGSLRLRLTSLTSRFPEVEAAVAPLLSQLGDARFAWYPTVGVGYLAGNAADPAVAAEVERLRLSLAPGAVVVAAAPPSLRGGSLDPWGPPPPAFALMKNLKQRFDPDGRLNPGRFVGGL